MKSTVLRADSNNSISHAVDVLHQGGVVAFPTDTVYGLGALAFMPESIERLFAIKGRAHTKAIAVLIADAGELEKIAAQPDPAVDRLAERFCPGPLTMVIQRHPSLPDSFSSGPTIGVRVPAHPVALDLLRAAGPMGVTSANLSGESNASTAEEVLAQLDGRTHLVLDGGQAPGGVPSTVIDLTSHEPKILREGPVTREEILATLD